MRRAGVWLEWAAAGIVGMVFAYAGIVKIWDFRGHDWATQQFFQDILNYQIFQALVGNGHGEWARLMATVPLLLAIYLPWVELSAGIALLVPRFRMGALLLLAPLTLIFTGAVASAWARGLDITCGCFGKTQNATNFPLHMGQNAGLLACMALLWVLEVRKSRRGEF